MSVLDLARTKIADALGESAHPALLYSGGKDSTLLLHLIREVRTDVPCIWFRTGEPDAHVKRAIIDYDLTVISYAPAQVLDLTDGESFSIVHDYRFGNHIFPLLIDVVPGTECSRTKYPHRTPEMYLPFDLILWGAKNSDSHWTLPGVTLKEDGAMAGSARLVAPLRHMTDEQVRSAIAEMNIPFTAANDELPLCTNCMSPGPGKVWCPELGKHIPTVQWERDRNLTAFRSRFEGGA